jgi:hypothetical protein
MNEFDFYTGTWDVVNRRRTDFLEDSCFERDATDWEEFPAISVASRHLDGIANFDEIEFPTKGIRGVTLRLFDREREEWALYWISSRTGMLTTPVVGRFVDGLGDFRGDDTIGDRKIRVRYLWSGITATTAHWEQAFSVDGERTWITNWIMDSTRR